MEEKEDIFKYGLKGGNEPEPKREIHVDKIFHSIFLFIKKVYKPVLIILLVILALYVGYNMKKIPVCPEVVECQECQVCPEAETCPDFNCKDCPREIEKVTVVRYACSNGFIVDDLDKCNPLNYVKINSPYKKTKDGITISIDRISFEDQGSYSRVTQIDYTILNNAEREINPVILVNLYSKSDPLGEQGLVHEKFDDEEFIKSNSFVIKKKKTSIGYTQDDMILRLILRDRIPDPDKELVRVERPIKI